MKKPRLFLVISDDDERLMLLSTTLHRKFPQSVVQTCRDSEAALVVARTQQLDAIVAHRSADMDELPLIESLKAATSAPVILISTAHHKPAALAAGVAFLHRDEWLLIGTTVAHLVRECPLAP